MKELNMKPEEIANLVVLSREKGYAMIIPVDALYLVSKALKERDAQIAPVDAEPVAELHNNNGRVIVNCLAEIPEGVTSVYLRAAPPARVKLPRGHILDCFGRLETDDDGVWLHKDAVIEALKDSGVEVADE